MPLVARVIRFVQWILKNDGLFHIVHARCRIVRLPFFSQLGRLHPEQTWKYV